jgi:outer membrane protein OmpA-like peptidoglycan-associated protein
VLIYSKDRRRRSEVGSQKSEVGSRNSEFRIQNSELQILKFSLFLIMFFIVVSQASSQSNYPGKEKKSQVLQETDVQSIQKEIEVTVRNVDITKFPLIKIFIEAVNKLGRPLDTIRPDELFVFEDGIRKQVLTVERIPVSDTVAADFVFCIDQTGSMQKYIDAVKRNITSFANTLMSRGIDYRLGLVLFSDDLEKVYQPTKNVDEFLEWLSYVKARGGGDEPENALEALEAASKMNFRIEANRVAVIITDAPYHQLGENGDGVTNQTTKSIIDLLIKNEIRLFSIAPPRLENYVTISRKTRGNFFDIDYPFSTILDNFSRQLTNLYAMTYRSDQGEIPDSIDIAILDKGSQKLVRRTIPIIELGRKLIIENLLYQSNKYDLPEAIKELDILAHFLKNKDKVMIMIEGHTDNVGDHATNDKLSIRRAESVKQYLVKRGIAASRITTIGYGKRRPIANNKNEFGRKLNRRTEIVIVSK